MRINKILVSALVMALSFYSCDYLDVPPINIIQDDAIFNSESGITSYMTTLYYDLPIEDFRYTQQGFNVSGKGQGRLPNVSGEAMCNLVGMLGLWKNSSGELLFEKFPGL